MNPDYYSHPMKVLPELDKQIIVIIEIVLQKQNFSNL